MWMACHVYAINTSIETRSRLHARPPRQNDMVSLSCIRLVLLLDHRPISLMEMANVAGFNAFELGATFLKVKTLLGVLVDWG